ncbi:unnamed protein product [Calypogeia fissa]
MSRSRNNNAITFSNVHTLPSDSVTLNSPGESFTQAASFHSFEIFEGILSTMQSSPGKRLEESIGGSW